MSALPGCLAVLQDEFGHPLVEASSLLVVGPDLLQPAVVSQGVLQSNNAHKIQIGGLYFRIDFRIGFGTQAD